MKRILVVDESKAVRETLALVLGRNFAIFQRPSLPLKDSFSYAGEKVDLLILGVSPRLGGESSTLLKSVSQVPFPVLFLVDSKPLENLWQRQGNTDCLAKPFSPYQLVEKVERLLAQSEVPLRELDHPSFERTRISRYADYPYVPASTSALAKRFALTSLPILILGEMGCGQERVARAIRSLNEKAGAWISVYAPEISREFLLGRLSSKERAVGERITLFLSGLETLHPSIQSSLLDFLEEEEERGTQFWILSSSQVDLLEKVYRGEFLEPLYYRLARLTLRLPPLRERQKDLATLATCLAREYGEQLDLGKVSLSADAVDRLCNYLWFGNLDEMEAVMARTLAAHRKGLIEAQDLVLGLAEDIQLAPPPAGEERLISEEKGEDHSQASPALKKELARVSNAGNGDFPDFRVIVNELAHELKNPMVTIKTFAQLLGDRYDDETFRVRFQETVGGDIERMDELLEVLLDFSRFTHPAVEKILLYEQLRRVLEEVVPDCIKKGATIRWGRKSGFEEVFTDEAQFRYAFRNVLRAVLAQLQPKGQIQIDLEDEGRVVVSYVREEARMSPFTHYLDPSFPAAEEEALPLRILLAKILLERNGGSIKISHGDGGRVLIRAELPVS
jgi:DNA-binding NtrC family response regulator